MAYDSDAVDLHASITCRIEGRKVKTTVGRVLLSEILPKELDFDQINKVLDKKALKNLVGYCYRHAGTKATVILSEPSEGPGLQVRHPVRHIHRCEGHGDPKPKAKHP